MLSGLIASRFSLSNWRSIFFNKSLIQLHLWLKAVLFFFLILFLKSRLSSYFHGDFLNFSIFRLNFNSWCLTWLWTPKFLLKLAQADLYLVCVLHILDLLYFTRYILKAQDPLIKLRFLPNFVLHSWSCRT